MFSHFIVSYVLILIFGFLIYTVSSKGYLSFLGDSSLQLFISSSFLLLDKNIKQMIYNLLKIEFSSLIELTRYIVKDVLFFCYLFWFLMLSILWLLAFWFCKWGFKQDLKVQIIISAAVQSIISSARDTDNKWTISI